MAAELCGGNLDPPQLLYGGHCDGASSLELLPGVSCRGGDFVADIHTAGSITLLIQAAMPCALLGQREPVEVTMHGGTGTDSGC